MKLKIIICCLFIGFFLTSKAQNEYTAIDNKMLKIPQSSTKTTTDIAEYINSNFTTKPEKLRAVYFWVAKNIQYDIDNMFTVSYYKDKQEVIDKVLKTRKGICVHYAMLFTDIANRIGIKSYVVDGYTKQNGKIDKIPHSWCVANIDSTWYLFDPTWASGYLLNNKFVRQVNNLYYKVKPEESIKSHMPFDPMWQLLDYPINNQAFYDGKFNDKKNNTFFNYNDTIKVYELESELEQLQSSSRRIEANGVKNSFISNKLEQNKNGINYYYEKTAIEKFNAAIDAYNIGVNKLSLFIQYRNKQFKPEKPDSEIKMMLDSAEYSLNTSQQLLKEIEKPTSNMLSSMKQLDKSINDANMNLNEQKAFLEKYFNTSKILRKSLFYKYTWMGIPLN